LSAIEWCEYANMPKAECEKCKAVELVAQGRIYEHTGEAIWPAFRKPAEPIPEPPRRTHVHQFHGDGVDIDAYAKLDPERFLTRPS
jgi:hypothetical protein